jgi:hypothetical protein
MIEKASGKGVIVGMTAEMEEITAAGFSKSTRNGVGPWGLVLVFVGKLG